VIVGAAQQASAADDPKKLFEAATAEFNLGHYEKAASMYEEIYKVTLEPVLLYNIAQAHRLGGDFDKAVFFYRGYLRAQPQAKNHSEVQRRIAELDEAIEAKRRGQERPPNVPATVEPHARTQPEPPPTVTPGPEPASQPRPSATPPPEAQPAPPEAQPTAQPATASNEAPASDKPVWKKWWFWTIIGGVVVVGVVVAVAVVATESPSFGANLPETGPAAHALTTSASTPFPSPLRLVEVRF
jgi:tetratricopeptide (TPR) repeat protein